MAIGSLPLGFSSPSSTSAIASAPASPGTQARRIAAQRSRNASRTSGRPLTTSSTTGVPVASDSLDQLLLPADERQLHPVPELAGRRFDGQPRALPHHDERHVRVRGRPHRLVELRIASIADAASARIGQLRAREPFPERGQDRPPIAQLIFDRHLVARRRAEPVCRFSRSSLQRLDVHQVAVVAEQVAGAVGDRTDDRDPLRPRSQRQDAVVLEQTRSSAGPAGGRAATPAPRGP